MVRCVAAIAYFDEAARSDVMLADGLDGGDRMLLVECGTARGSGQYRLPDATVSLASLLPCRCRLVQLERCTFKCVARSTIAGHRRGEPFVLPLARGPEDAVKAPAS
jgi:hypothetical protein